MAITIATVIKNMCLSRRQKSDLVSFRSCILTRACLTDLVTQNLTKHLYTQAVQNLSSMSHYQHFSYIKFLGKSWQNFTKNLFYTGRYDLPEMLIQQSVEFPTAVTHKSLTVWSHLMDHRKAQRVDFRNGIRDFRCFGQSETRN
jgi:hypothetical protein